jgi:hypothetical protein
MTPISSKNVYLPVRTAWPGSPLIRTVGQVGSTQASQPSSPAAQHAIAAVARDPVPSIVHRRFADVSSLGNLVEHVDRALHQHSVHLVAVAVIGNLGQEGHRREHSLDRASIRRLGLPAPQRLVHGHLVRELFDVPAPSPVHHSADRLSKA